MIKGTGIDIIEVSRIRKSIQNSRFIKKVYTEREQQYLADRNMNSQTASGIFCAKEAVSKALGTGFGKVAWTDIEICRDDNGKPYVVLYGAASEVMKQLGGSTCLVSITHTKEYAAAHAILE